MQLFHTRTVENQLGRAGVWATFDRVLGNIVGHTLVDGESLSDTITHDLVLVIRR